MNVPQNQNVTRINQNRVYNHIMAFLKNKEKRSHNTARRYERDIRDFFLYLRNKDIEDLEPEDLKVTNAEALDYQNYLTEKCKNSTTNVKFGAIRSLYNFFKVNDYDVNPHALKVDNLPSDSRPIGYLSPDEVFMLADLALKHESYNRYMKRALILLAFATSMRLSALLKLKYSDIRQSEKDPKKYIIETYDYLDKAKQIYKEIHESVYQTLIEAREMDKRVRTDDRIFTMDEKGVTKMMKRLCEIAGFDPRRNISFHSIRKAGADFAYEYTGGDLVAVTAQGNWSSPTTPYKHYLKQQANITGMAAFEKIDEDVFDKLTHEELLQLVKSQTNGFGQKLKRDAQEILNNRMGDEEA